MNPKWLDWTERLQAIAQIGLTYSENPYDIERYQQMRQIAAEILSTHSETESDFILDLFNQEVGYATPKVDVRAAVFQDDKLLLVRERVDGGRWTLPGGWADVGDSPSRAIEREVYEESGYQTKAVKLLAVYDRNHPRHGHPPFLHAVYKLFFRCELVSGTSADSYKADPYENYETEEATFFAEAEIPELSLGRVVPTQIVRLFEHYRNSALPTDFD